MEKFIDKIIAIMKNNNAISDDEEIVRYGLEIVIMKLIFCIIIVTLGICLHCFIESVIFTVAFSLLRMYGGGYHAKTRGHCFLLSLITLIVALSIIKISGEMSNLIILVIGFAVNASIYIYFSAPVDTENKRLDIEEMNHYGKRARVLVTILLITSAAFLIMGYNKIACSVMIGIIIEGILMLIGYIQNHYIKTITKRTM